MRGGWTGLAQRSRTAQVRLGYALALAGTALVSLLIAGIRAYAHIPNLSLLYLFVVLALASTIGRRPAVLAAVLAFLAYNFLFVEPRYTFTIHDPHQWLALLVFLVTALVAGQLTAALREQAEEARRREQIAAMLYDLSRALVTKQEPERLLEAVAERVVAVFGARSCAILLPDEAGRLRVRVGRAAAGGAVLPLTPGEETFVNRTFTDRHGPDAERHGAVLYVPLHTGDRRLGVLRVEERGGAVLPDDGDRRLLATFAAQAALALEQARLVREEGRAEVLARADAAKDALLSSVSHDLRTPLAAIRAAAGSLLEAIDWDPETRREFAAAIDEEAQRLNRLVGALLEMSRIDAGALQSRKEFYPLDDLIRAALARAAPLAEATDRRLAAELPERLPPVPLDPVQLELVLDNLLDNALKYTPPGTPITVTAGVAGGEVVVGVADRGPGIAPADRARVFEKFQRLAPDGPAPGSGLGLAIARGLIEAHGGRIWVEAGPGGGARFRFTLPLPHAAPGVAALEPVATLPASPAADPWRDRAGRAGPAPAGARSGGA